MTLNEIENHVTHRTGLRVELAIALHIVGNIRALAGLLLGKEFGIHCDPVFQIVHADFCRLMESHCAEVPRDLDSARMRRVNRCL